MRGVRGDYATSGEKLGIIAQTSPEKRDRIYCVREILAILEEPTKITQL